MRLLFIMVVFAAVACIFSSAFAAVEGFPDTLAFYNAPLALDFNVTNPTDTAKRVSVEFLAPVNANIILPGNIPAKQSAGIQMTLYPKEEMVGQEYESTLIVRVGDEETRKTVKVSFNPAKSGFGIPGVTGAISFFSAPNAELAVDIVLAIVVVVLLIAFISRLVKRFHGE